jgi:hypothetical protein
MAWLSNVRIQKAGAPEYFSNLREMALAKTHNSASNEPNDVHVTVR